MSAGEVGRVLENPEVVARVHVWRNDQPLRGAGVLYLKGTTHDVYAAAGDFRWEWSRSYGPDLRFEAPVGALVGLPRESSDGDVYRQKIRLEPLGSQILFAMSGPIAFKSGQKMAIQYSRDDETILGDQGIGQAVEYEVHSAGTPGRPNAVRRAMIQLLAGPPRSNAKVLDEIERFTRREEVVGEAGLRRPRMPRISRSLAAARSMPRKRRCRASTCACGGVSFRIARPVMLLPEPDSPTMPTFSRPTVKLTPRTAGTFPCSEGKVTESPSTVRIGSRSREKCPCSVRRSRGISCSTTRRGRAEPRP